MAQHEYGGYAAYTVGNGIRFQKLEGGKKYLVKEADLPPTYGDYFKQVLGVPLEKAPSRFDQATAPEVAATVKPDEEVPPFPAPELNEEDFDDKTWQTPDDLIEPTILPPVPPQPTQVEISAPPTEPVTARVGASGDNITPPAPQGDMPGVNVDDPMAGMSIFDASLEDMAKAMHERFGIYTVFTRHYPETDEISPLTGEPMTKYDRGLAYQAARRALDQGRLDNVDYYGVKEELAKSRAASEIEQNRPDTPLNVRTAEQERDQNSFAYRTSVRGGNENPNGMRSRPNPDGTDEPIAEPAMTGKPIIRPRW